MTAPEQAIMLRDANDPDRRITHAARKDWGDVGDFSAGHDCRRVRGGLVVDEGADALWGGKSRGLDDLESGRHARSAGPLYHRAPVSKLEID